MKIKGKFTSLVAALSLSMAVSASAQSFEPDYVGTIRQKCDPAEESFNFDERINGRANPYVECTRRAFNIPINIAQDFNKLLALHLGTGQGFGVFGRQEPQWDPENPQHRRAMTFNDICNVTTTPPPPSRTKESLETFFNQPIFCLNEVLGMSADLEIEHNTSSVEALRDYLEMLRLDLLIDA